MLINIELHEAGHREARAAQMELCFPGDSRAPGRSRASEGPRELTLVQEHSYSADTKSLSGRCLAGP